MSASRIPRPSRDELDGPRLQLRDELVAARSAGTQHFAVVDDEGRLNGPFNALLLSPGAGSALERLGRAVRFDTALDARCRELAILAVAAHWRSAFERNAHEAVGRALGLDDDVLREVAEGRIPDGLPAAERRTLEVVAALLRGDVSDEEWRAWSDEPGAQAVFELSTLVGYYATLALQLRVFRADG